MLNPLTKELHQPILIPVILAGGVGSRLWPLSRDLYPKQLLSLIGEQTLLQATVARVLQIPAVCHVIIVCSQQYEFLIEEQLEPFKKQYSVTFDLILEPVGRNTAPALALGALRAAAFENPYMLALPADHVLGNAAFIEQIQQILPLIENQLVTFGVKPHYAETGYGYIEVDSAPSMQQLLPIKRFVEKPDLVHAEIYCNNKYHYWNSGIFLYKATTYLAELRLYAPHILNVCEQAWAQRTTSGESIYLAENLYSQCPDISIDYAIMEKTQAAAMAPLVSAWDDVGSWLAVSKLDVADGQNNVCLGDVMALHSQNCYLRSESRLLAVVGLHNQIVVETADAVLVADKSHAQNIKQLVEQLKKQQRKEAEAHAVLYQTWGQYEIVCKGEGFTVKQITIKPKSSLMATTDVGICEHWVVLSGAAQVQVAGLSSVLSINQSIDILPSTHYRIDNESMVVLKLLSVHRRPTES